MRRFHRLLLSLALLTVASPLLAYTIYLKDGSKLLARQKYTVNGATAEITLHNGAQTTLPMARIDVPKTEAANASDYGDATVLSVPQPPPKPTQPLPSQNLAGVLSHSASTLPAPAPPPRPVPAAPAVATATGAAGNALAHTAAGTVDFMRAPRTPISRVDLGTLLSEKMRVHGVESAGIYQGSSPRRVLVEVVTNSEGAVFQGIAAAAQSLLDVEAKQPGSLDAIELFLATDKRQRAGQFLITTERANELKTRQLNIAAFYLKYVEF